jgi:hypothetical protein
MVGMFGIAMFYVGAVLVVNGAWLLGKADIRGAGIFNFLVGILITIMAINNHFEATELVHHLGTANALLFGFTYLALAANTLFNLDGRALGWFCLFVAAVTVPNFLFNFAIGDVRFGIIWFLWGFLWFIFYLSLAMGIARLTRPAAWLSIIIGLLTAGIPGYMMLWGVW